jgi:hypothetical protein
VWVVCCLLTTLVGPILRHTASSVGMLCTCDAAVAAHFLRLTRPHWRLEEQKRQKTTKAEEALTARAVRHCQRRPRRRRRCGAARATRAATWKNHRPTRAAMYYTPKRREKKTKNAAMRLWISFRVKRLSLSIFVYFQLIDQHQDVVT